MTPEDLRRVVFERLPPVDDHHETVEVLHADGVELRLPFDSGFVGTEVWGGNAVKVISGPVLMGLADTAMYAACLVVAGIETLAVMVTMTSSFLQPATEADLLADARVRRRGGRLAYLDCSIRSADAADPCAHMVATYALRAR
jgi:acyl-coenzyme A thioesterase PaaI-like protein